MEVGPEEVMTRTGPEGLRVDTDIKTFSKRGSVNRDGSMNRKIGK